MASRPVKLLFNLTPKRASGPGFDVLEAGAIFLVMALPVIYLVLTALEYRAVTGRNFDREDRLAQIARDAERFDHLEKRKAHGTEEILLRAGTSEISNIYPLSLERLRAFRERADEASRLDLLQSVSPGAIHERLAVLGFGTHEVGTRETATHEVATRGIVPHGVVTHGVVTLEVRLTRFALERGADATEVTMQARSRTLEEMTEFISRLVRDPAVSRPSVVTAADETGGIRSEIRLRFLEERVRR